MARCGFNSGKLVRRFQSNLGTTVTIFLQLWLPFFSLLVFVRLLFEGGYYSRAMFIMAYGSTPYVGMTPPKNGGHNKSAQMTRYKCLH